MENNKLLKNEFEKIRKREPLTAKAVVKEALNPKSKLYPFFKDIITNPDRAMRLALEQRARNLINYVHIEIMVHNYSRDVPLYEIVTVQTSNGESKREYNILPDILNNADYRQQILNSTRSSIQTLQEKLDRFEEFKSVVASLKKVEETIDKLIKNDNEKAK